MQAAAVCSVTYWMRSLQPVLSQVLANLKVRLAHLPPGDFAAKGDILSFAELSGVGHCERIAGTEPTDLQCISNLQNESVVWNDYDFFLPKPKKFFKPLQT